MYKSPLGRERKEHLPEWRENDRLTIESGVGSREGESGGQQRNRGWLRRVGSRWRWADSIV
jgi:hypothetical protein